MSKRVAVVLSGCGVYDGSEIHEAVFTLLALDLAGAEYQCCAPDKPQMHVINHLAGAPTDEQRNVLVESARIARGNIVPITEIKPADYDAIVLPGGFGAAKNLSTYAVDGPDASVDADIAAVLNDFRDAGKPIGAWCIAPVVLAKVFGQQLPGLNLTIGNDAATADHLRGFGAHHTDSPVIEAVTDDPNRIVTCPAYMLEATPAQVYEGIRNAVNEVLRLA